MIPANQDMPESTRKLRAQPPTRDPAAHSPGEKRGAWYLLTGVILGLIFGLAYARLLDPVVYENATPASFRDSSKDIYRSMIAQTYEETGDLARAASRLALLEDPDPVYALGAQAQQALAEGQPKEAHALALLASALQESTTAQNEPVSTETPLAVPTQTLPIPTPTP
jgi:hypothetical protein